MSTVVYDGVEYEHDVYSALCPCRELLDLLANKWSALAIGALEDGPRRFGVLQRKLQGISPKVLTQALRRLEESGFVDRVVYPAVPSHVEYSLTGLGQSASVPLALLRTWALENINNVPRLVTGVAHGDESAPSPVKPIKG
jgi:DNA-binding HxlR family transcriptional regulator